MENGTDRWVDRWSRRVGLILGVIALSASLTGAGYNYRGLVQAAKEMDDVKADVKKLQTDPHITRDEMEKAIDKLDKRMARIEDLLISHVLATQGSAAIPPPKVASR